MHPPCGRLLLIILMPYVGGAGQGFQVSTPERVSLSLPWTMKFDRRWYQYLVISRLVPLQSMVVFYVKVSASYLNSYGGGHLRCSLLVIRVDRVDIDVIK